MMLVYSVIMIVFIIVIKVFDCVLDVGLLLVGVIILVFGECDGVGVIEVKVVGNLIFFILLFEVVIFRVF